MPEFSTAKPDLQAIENLSPSNDDIIQRKAGAWVNRTMAQLLADLGLGDAMMSTRTVSAKTADYTVTAADCAANTIFTNEGASGVVRFTLPVNAGLTGGKHKCSFVAVVDYPIEIIMGQGSLYYFNIIDGTPYVITTSAHATTSGNKGERMDVEFLYTSCWSGRPFGNWAV